MSLDKIIEKIEQETRAKATEIINSANLQAQGILLKTKTEAEELTQANIIEAKNEAIISAQREKTAILLEWQKKKLQAKQELIDKVYAEVEERILSWDDQEYLVFIKKQLLKAIETGSEEIMLSPKDSGKINIKFIQEINSELKKQDRRGELRLSKTNLPIKGGFILRQGQVELNYSLEAILKRLREETEQQVATLLFGDNKESV